MENKEAETKPNYPTITKHNCLSCPSQLDLKICYNEYRSECENIIKMLKEKKANHYMVPLYMNTNEIIHLQIYERVNCLPSICMRQEREGKTHGMI